MLVFLYAMVLQLIARNISKIRGLLQIYFNFIPLNVSLSTLWKVQNTIIIILFIEV
jgi:hypothetical protein